MITSRMDLGGKYIATTEVGQVKAFFQQSHMKAGFAVAALLATGIAFAPTAACAFVAGGAMVCGAGMMLAAQKVCALEARTAEACIETKPLENEKTHELFIFAAEAKTVITQITMALELTVAASMAACGGVAVFAFSPSVAQPSEIAFGVVCGVLTGAPCLARSVASRHRWGNVASGKWVLKDTPPAREPEKFSLKSFLADLVRPPAAQPA